MKVASCLKKKEFKNIDGITLQHIMKKHDVFYKLMNKICEDANIPLTDQKITTKKFYYYLKPEKNSKKAASNFDSLMYTNTIAIHTKDIQDAKIYGFLLKTIIEDTYDFYNDKLESMSQSEGKKYLLSEIENMNYPIGLFENKPLIPALYETQKTITFNANDLYKLIDTPFHLMLKGLDLVDYVLKK